MAIDAQRCVGIGVTKLRLSDRHRRAVVHEQRRVSVTERLKTAALDSEFIQDRP